MVELLAKMDGLLNANFSIDDIAKILYDLDPNEAHGHDKVSIRMLQLCGVHFQTVYGKWFFYVWTEKREGSSNSWKRW